VICEIMNDDGTMARVPDLIKFCMEHSLKMITVAELICYRTAHERYEVVEHIPILSANEYGFDSPEKGPMIAGNLVGAQL